MTTQKIPSQFDVPPKAVLISTDRSGAQVIEVTEFLTIGRDSGSGLELSDPFVSGRHARLERKENGFLLRDLRSQNGTWVNESRIMEAFLSPGDKIRFGEKEFRFENHLPNQDFHPALRSLNEGWAKAASGLPLFARTELPVLLLGASGTGKEVLARLVHDYSARSKGPFVGVNCSALSESLIESELFGHIRGSFTGASHDRAGAFEAARGGTLFLDEIGDLPLGLQPKLLRALENREIRPVGSDKNIETNVRIVAATHKNLQAQVARGAFRADLFYRLHVIRIQIPPLKDRMEDFESFLYKFAREMRVGFSFDAIQCLKSYPWPGNIRELRNAVARASALFAGRRIEKDDVPYLVDSGASPTGSSTSEPMPVFNAGRPYLKELEKDMIMKKLVEHQGNQRRAALELGIPKSTLHDRIRAYGIDLEKLLLNSSLS